MPLIFLLGSLAGHVVGFVGLGRSLFFTWLAHRDLQRTTALLRRSDRRLMASGLFALPGTGEQQLRRGSNDCLLIGTSEQAWPPHEEERLKEESALERGVDLKSPLQDLEEGASLDGALNTNRDGQHHRNGNQAEPPKPARGDQSNGRDHNENHTALPTSVLPKHLLTQFE